ncbi:MAG: response regulator [Planctomycetota bacterium]
MSANEDHAGRKLNLHSPTPNISSKQFSSFIPKLLELVSDLVFSLSPDAERVLYLNPAAEKIYGRPTHEISSDESWIESIHTEDRAELLEQIATINRTKNFDCEFRMIQPNGMVRFLSGNFRRILNEQHQLLAIGCIAKDITNRVKTEIKLDESQAIYQSLVESLPINVFRKDRDGKIVFVNNKYCETVGRPRDSLIGQTDFDLFDRQMAEKYQNDDKWVLQTGLPFHDIEFHQREGNEYIYVEVLKAPVTSSSGRRIGIQGMFWDVTDRKKGEIELEKAKDLAVAASKAKSDFLANVSHEIRTPLNAVIGLTDLLLQSRTDKTQNEYLQMIQDSGDSLLSLINDILDFSKIESGKLDIQNEWFDLREKMGDTLRALALRAHAKNVDLVCKIDKTIPSQILGDVQRLRQILTNLVGNSIKFTQRGEIVVSMDVIEKTTEQIELEFRIKDTGIGIAEEKLNEIFEEFVQADTSTTRKYGGSGLGLSIATKLVELMGGELKVQSEIDQGTEFFFNLPFTLGVQSESLVPPKEFSDIPILVVSPNATLLDSIHDILKSWRMNSFCVRDDSQAIKLAKGMTFSKQPIQIVLADSSLRGDDERCECEDLARQITDDPEITNPVFIAMVKAKSGQGNFEHVDQVISHRIMQPPKYSELRDAIYSCLQTSVQPLSDIESKEKFQHGPLKILLAEDNPVNQKLAVTILEKHGHQMTVVNTGKQALGAVAQQTFDLVLMDIQMPEMDGIEATGRIRKLEQPGNRLPIIAMTAHAMPQDRQRCLMAGMDEYISKPFKAHELTGLIDHVFASRSHESSSSGTFDSEASSIYIDWNQAFETVGGDRKLLVEIIQIFLSGRENQIAELKQAIDANNLAERRRLAHTLKGTLRHLGVIDIAKNVEIIEQAEEANQNLIVELFNELQNQINQLTIELERFTNNYLDAQS